MSWHYIVGFSRGAGAEPLPEREVSSQNPFFFRCWFLTGCRGRAPAGARGVLAKPLFLSLLVSPGGKEQSTCRSGRLRGRHIFSLILRQPRPRKPITNDTQQVATTSH